MTQEAKLIRARPLTRQQTTLRMPMRRRASIRTRGFAVLSHCLLGSAQGTSRLLSVSNADLSCGVVCPAHASPFKKKHACELLCKKS